MMLTVDLLMSTNPCTDWPRERVARLLASPTVDASSWVAFAESCRARKWRAPTLADLRLTACRYAAAHHRTDVLTPWVQEVTRLRVAAQRKRHGAVATPETLAIWTALEVWDGTETQARVLRDRANAEWRRNRTAAADAAAAADADAVEAAEATLVAAVYAAAAAAAAAAYAAADAAADWRLLLSLCQRLDVPVHACQPTDEAA
jgi:hypothetical protein